MLQHRNYNNTLAVVIVSSSAVTVETAVVVFVRVEQGLRSIGVKRPRVQEGLMATGKKGWWRS